MLQIIDPGYLFALLLKKPETMSDSEVATYNYDELGASYHRGRRTEPRIARQLWQLLDPRQSILNIGAGAGSYEPAGADLVALEPSAIMMQQRSGQPVTAVQGLAEQLPFADQSFDQAMTVLSMHHWPDQAKAFREIRRVCRKRFVALTWDPESEPFWVTRDYFPEIRATDQLIFPTMAALRAHFSGCKIDVEVVPVPCDCQDGFFAAYWRRPQAYLDPAVRACMSTFARLGNIDPALEQLADDLQTGRWQERNAALLELDSLDAGYRLLVVEFDSAAGTA